MRSLASLAHAYYIEHWHLVTGSAPPPNLFSIITPLYIEADNAVFVCMFRS